MLPDYPRYVFPVGTVESNPADLGEEIRIVYDPANLPPYNGVLFTSSNSIHLTPGTIMKCD